MDHNESTFMKVFAATFIGAYLGHKLDQTRFGIWFNTNRTIDFIFTVIVSFLQTVAIALLLWFIILVVIQFSK